MKKYACLLTCLLSMLALADGAPYVGMGLQPPAKDLCAYLDIEGGAQVAQVYPDSPAAKAGVKAGDIIVSWNGKAIGHPQDVVKIVKSAKPGDKVNTEALRKGKKLSITLVVGKQDAEAKKVKPKKPAKVKGFLGVTCEEVPPILVAYLGLTKENPGVLIKAAINEFAAKKAGVKANDLILSLDGKPIAGRDAFIKAMAGKHAGDKVTLEGLRAGKPLKITATLGKWPKVTDLPGHPNPFELQPPHVLPLEKHVDPKQRLKQNKGVLRFKDRTGKEYRIEIPGILELENPHFKLPEGLLGQDLEGLKADFDVIIKEARKKIGAQSKDLEKKHHDLLKTLKEQFKVDTDGHKHMEKAVMATSVATIDENGLRITVKNENGRKTVSVKDGDKVLAKDLPYEKLDTLPKAIQDKVKGMNASVKIHTNIHVPEKPAPRRKKPVQPKAIKAPSAKI